MAHDGKLVPLYHGRCLIHLATEADDDVRRDVGVPRIPRQHPFENPVIFAAQNLTTTRLVSQCNHAVDARKVPLNVAEPLTYELRHAGRAIHGGDERDVVARSNPPVGPSIAFEVTHPLGWIEI